MSWLDNLSGFQPSFLNVDRHWKTQVGHGAITLVVGLAGYLVGPWYGRALVTVALLFYLLREWNAHAFYHQNAQAGKIGPQELRKHLWDSKMDVAWPLFAWAFIWMLPFAFDTWPWWIGVSILLLAIGRKTDPGGQAGGMT